MKESKFNIQATQSVDINEATQAVKENRFSDALKLLKINLYDNPENIDVLYLAAVSARFLKKFDESQEYLEKLLTVAPDMGRAYQELGHLIETLKWRESCCSLLSGMRTKSSIITSWIFYINTLHHTITNLQQIIH